MIIKFDFGNDYIQYVSCSTKAGRKINKLEREFLAWVFDEEKNKKYWAFEDGTKAHPNYDAHAIVDWLNNVKFKKGTAKAKVIETPKTRIQKTVYL